MKSSSRRSLMALASRAYAGIRRESGNPARTVVSMVPVRTCVRGNDLWILWDRTSFDVEDIEGVRVGEDIFPRRVKPWIEVVAMRTTAAGNDRGEWSGKRIPLRAGPMLDTCPASFVARALDRGWLPETWAMDYVERQAAKGRKGWRAVCDRAAGVVGAAGRFGQ